MSNMKRYMRKRGFTDRLYLTNFFITWVFVAMCFLATIFSGVLGIADLSVLSTAIGCAFAELGAHTCLIIWKAKVENIEKHKLDMDIMNIV